MAVNNRSHPHFVQYIEVRISNIGHPLLASTCEKFSPQKVGRQLIVRWPYAGGA
jgi:hypothetical protein